MTSAQIRQQFLDFFASKGHVYVPSSPVVPHDDPTLMFANAGMNQFKPIFLGAARADHPRVANSQKCIRAGGKHNDLDDVGQDTYHHTFFEMLGNWSFGDYFKKEAIEWAWELLTKVWGIDKSRLHATYFGGQRKATKPRSHEATEGVGTEARRHEATEGEVRRSKFKVQNEQSSSNFELRTSNFELEPDEEARDLWLRVTDIDPSHVHPGSMKDNFWEMGDTGPCGPCSEIHIDLTPDKSGRDLVNKGDARVIEIWNLVFIQFNRGADGKLTPLPAKHVDTGMGFERLCAVLQGTQQGRIGQVSNYDTDVFTPIFDAIRKRTGAPPYRGTLPDQSRDREGAVDGSDEATKRRSDEGYGHEGTEARRHEAVQSTIDNRQSTIMVDVSYRVIADHLRCLVFALTDGAIPSNEGRGYVLRRILRRAVRYGRQYLNMHEPFLCDIVPTVVEHMGDVFPELRKAHGGKNIQHVTELIRDEEASFLTTLDRGMRVFTAIAAACKRSGKYGTWAAVGHLTSLIYKTFHDPRGVTLGSDKSWNDLPSTREIHEEIQLTGQLRTLVTHEVLKAIIEKPGIVPGKVAFLLHDTYGFPIDLTQLMASELGLTVDIVEYERLMEEARDRARAPRDLQQPAWREHFEGMQATSFVGHETTEIDDAFLLHVLPMEQGSIKDAMRMIKGQNGYVVLSKSPCYPEQGGQVGDCGSIACDNEGWEFEVADTQRVANKPIVHFGSCTRGEIQVPNFAAGTFGLDSPEIPPQIYHPPVQARVTVDLRRRIPTMQNHTATHILNWALREVLGEHVQQKGSLVDPEKTRFDFSHNHVLTGEEISRIESLVKKQIGDALDVNDMLDGRREVPQKAAREINTLRAVFGEKYPDLVRVVSIGPAIKDLLADPKNPRWMQYSVEFCGGTHLKNSKEAEDFVLVHEEAVAKGVRRLVGLTAEKAREAKRHGEQLLEIAEALRTGSHPPSLREDGAPGTGGQAASGTRASWDLTRLLRELSEATIPVLTRHQLAGQIAILQESAKEEQKKSTAQAQRGAVEAVAEMLAAKSLDVAGVTVLVAEVPHGNADALRSGIDYVRNKKGSSAVLLASVDDGRVTLVAGMSKDVVERGVKAGDLIKEICPLVGGKGGGRPDMAQGGGTDPTGLPKALDRAREWLGERLS